MFRRIIQSENGGVIGVIGGSGLYKMEGLDVKEKITIETPYGPPSDEIILGELRGKNMAFLPRHGLGHFIPPSEINFRANIFAMTHQFYPLPRLPHI